MTAIDCAELRLRLAVEKLNRLRQTLRTVHQLDPELRVAFHIVFRERKDAERELVRLCGLVASATLH